MKLLIMQSSEASTTPSLSGPNIVLSTLFSGKNMWRGTEEEPLAVNKL